MPSFLLSRSAASSFDLEVILPLCDAFARTPFDAAELQPYARIASVNDVRPGAEIDLVGKVGFLFECYVRYAISRVSREIGLAQCSFSGEFGSDGIGFTANPLGNISFYSGRNFLAKIDALYLHKGVKVQTPIVMDATVSSESTHSVGMKRKMSFAGRLFPGLEMHYLKVRPAASDEAPGPYIRPELPQHRKILLPVDNADVINAAVSLYGHRHSSV